MRGEPTNTRFLETDYISKYTRPHVGGTGSASLLTMTEEDVRAVEARKIPLGFVAEAPKPKRRSRKK